eukprot:scaffold1388_cov267-Chaetoceros_neogracile.AAC.69
MWNIINKNWHALESFDSQCNAVIAKCVAKYFRKSVLHLLAHFLRSFLDFESGFDEREIEELALRRKSQQSS